MSEEVQSEEPSTMESVYYQDFGALFACNVNQNIEVLQEVITRITEIRSDDIHVEDP